MRRHTKEEIRSYWEDTLRDVFRSMYSNGSQFVTVAEVEHLMRRDEHGLAAPILNHMVEYGALTKENDCYFITHVVLGSKAHIKVGDCFRNHRCIIQVTGFSYRGKPYSTLGDFVLAHNTETGRRTSLKRSTLCRDYSRMRNSPKGLFVVA